jgi:peptidoglycan hydrolase-like protein with peptidoglycan-binding domain
VTAAALTAFQRSHGLEPDGKVGPATFAAIDAALAGG